MPHSPPQPVDNSVSPPDSDGGIGYECPRCGAEVVAPFYGPCETCRGTLRATITAEAEDVAAADYEPKMNVTPNAVATKE